MTRGIDRRTALKQMLAVGFGASAASTLILGCDPPGLAEDCSLDDEPPFDDAEPHLWAPTVVKPVFYGCTDYEPTDELPVKLRVFYPSRDGVVLDGSFYGHPLGYPLVVLLHGQCHEEDHYLSWWRSPSVLARSGFIVAVPDLHGIDHPDVDTWTAERVTRVVEWLGTRWCFRNFLVDRLGLVGHSYGGLHAAKLASPDLVKAVAVIASNWDGLPPLDTLTVPKLFAWGTADLAAPPPPEDNWLALPSDKHRVTFHDAGHWDFVVPSGAACGTEVPAGPCDLTAELTADLVALFMSRYVHSLVGIRVPDSLEVPDTPLTDKERFYAGAHLTSFTKASNSSCCAELDWETANESGKRSLAGDDGCLG